MAGSVRAGLRTAALAVVGFAAVAAGVATGHALHDEGFLLAAAGGFALGIAASVALAGARAEGRAEGEERAARALGERAVEPPAGALAIAPTNGREAPRPEGGVATTRASVAAVAHDMANPLASLRSNLEWLRDALEEGRLPRDEAEAREVLRDAREATERLRVDVGALRAAGRGEASRPQNV
jgi:signal transduction histidine kinase